MYQEFFSLKQQPFSIAPAPDFLFFTEQHKEALAYLTYGLQGNGGFVVLTGEVGTGKTTICQYLLQDMPEDTDLASITNPAVSEISLLVDICNQFSIDYDSENINLKVMFDALTSWMLANHLRGRHAIVLIDEAQHLSFKILEQLRLLTNIESNNQKPLQIILVGQTALQEKLLTTELRQLSQRITARYHLRTLNKQETTFYIHHRLNRSGAREPIFQPSAINIIFKASNGTPGFINQLCDRCLLSAYTQSSSTISKSIAKKVVSETELPQLECPKITYIPQLVVISSAIILALLLNMQKTTIIDYFKPSEQTSMQQEWSNVIRNTTNQTSHKSTKTIDPTPATLEDKLNDIALITPETLLAVPSTSYSLQLAALPNTASVRSFYNENKGLEEDTYIYYRNRSGSSKYVILMDTFSSYKAAKLASKALSQTYPQIDPWVRDYKTIHSDIK